METGTEVNGGLGAGPSLASDELVADIARHLEATGEYRITVVPRPPQRLVDIRWAALGAGRLLGRSVNVAMSRAVHVGDAPVTVRVSCPPPRPAIPRMRDGADD